MRKIWQRYKNRKYDGYTPVSDSVDWQTAMSQAVVALDHAAHLSIKTKNPSGMREVAVGWLAVAESIAGAVEAGEDEEVDLDASDNNDIYPLGFRANPVEEDEEEEHEEE